MLIDINTYIGHWPFRQIRNNTAEGLLKVMDGACLDIACVSSINSIFYKDSQEGNLELSEEIKPYKDRFIPFAIINPAYPGWKKDFLHCVDDLGMKGLELYPYYHGYKLSDGPSTELINLAGQKGVPVHLPFAVVNIRQRHHLDTNENLSSDEVEKIVDLCPDTDIILTNGPTDQIAQKLALKTGLRKGKIFYDFARLTAIPGLQSLIKHAGSSRIVFGSVIPFQYAAPQLLKLEFTGLAAQDMENISSNNLAGLLKLH